MSVSLLSTGHDNMRSLLGLMPLIMSFSLPLIAAENDLPTSCQWDEYTAESFSDCLAFATQGIPSAQYTVGRAYLLGMGVEKNQIDGESWILEAAKSCFSDAEYFAGLIYESRFGAGEENDLNKAKDWLTKAAKQGHVDAQYSLALIYLGGKGGVGKNVGEAVKWLSFAGDEGNSEASMYLSDLYRKGVDVTKNNDEALKWLLRAAEDGHREAQTDLGIGYLHGNELVAKNYSEALKWLTKSADQGIAEAQVLLGFVFSSGQDAQKKNTEAIKWFAKAIEQGRSDDICLVYYQPLDYLKSSTHANLHKALEWCSNEAEKGNSDAQFALAVMYKNGKGMLPKNNILAYKWVLIAESNKHELSKELLKKWAFTGVSDEDRKKTLDLVRSWKPNSARPSTVTR